MVRERAPPYRVEFCITARNVPDRSGVPASGGKSKRETRGPPGAGLALPCRPLYALRQPGGMAERLKAHAWKACIRATVSWVRIPLPPPGCADFIGVFRIYWDQPTPPPIPVGAMGAHGPLAWTQHACHDGRPLRPSVPVHRRRGGPGSRRAGTDGRLTGAPATRRSAPEASRTAASRSGLPPRSRLPAGAHASHKRKGPGAWKTGASLHGAAGEAAAGALGNGARVAQAG